MGAARPPLKYLATCSQMSLESVELSRLNLAANLRKEFQEVLDEWIDSEVDAQLARSILEWRREQDIAASMPALEAAKPPQLEQLAIAFLPECSALPAGDAVERDSQSLPEEIPSRRDDPPRDSVSEYRSPVRLRDDNAPMVGKESRSIAVLVPCSTSLARAAAVNSGAAQGLVEPLSGKLQVYRKTIASPNGARKTGSKPTPILAAESPSWAVHMQAECAAQYSRVRRAG